ncbi:MAG: DNA polymerase III subunit gamma/tau [Chloroflexi bacterium]|nr:DNA polymerase III subunit gamma/tau [Chloroflexota bacterium]
MPKQALYLKWRPTTFNDVVGQEHITRTLRNSLKSGRIRHAYLFSGPRGTGKTTMARLLAKALNCRDADPDNRPCNVCPACVAVNEGRYLDLIEIDAATHTGVDDVRDLRDKIAFAPGEGAYKVYIIDEVHRFTGNAFDALLKTLEEPPAHAIFVLATTEIDKVPATIKSRCLPFEFRRIPLLEVADRLQLIAESEGLQIERPALELIARYGTGSVRDSISLLDQIVADPEEIITLEMAQQVLGTASLAAVKDLVDALARMDAASALHIINIAVDAGADPRQFGQQVVEHLRAVLLAQTASADLVEASREDQALYEAQAETIPRGMLVRAIRTFNDAVNTYRGGWQPQLALELALMEALEPEPAPAVMWTNAAAPLPPPDLPQPPVEATPPGAPPVVELAAIRELWGKSMHILGQRSSNAPEVMRYFRALRVDGNVIYLGTDTELYYEKLQYPEKVQLLEQVFSHVHKKPLRVKIVLVNSGEIPGKTPLDSVDMSDPLASLGAELGAEIKPHERRRSQK